MAWTNRKGFNFRSTASYVTDGTNEVCVNKNNTDDQVGPAYPTSATIDGDSVTYGYTMTLPADGERDRLNTADRRIAGVHFHGSGGTLVFQVDLPQAGIYEIHIGTGEHFGSVSPNVQIYDNTTLLHTVSGSSIGAGNFLDANNAVYSAASWPGSETGKNLTFSSTTLVVQVPSGGVIAHLGIKYIGSATVYDPITSCFPIGYYE